MKTCVGPKCLTPKDTACVSARPAANISRRACCRTARSCWKRRPLQNELPPVRHTFLRLLAAQNGRGLETIHARAVHEQGLQLPADRAYTLDVNLELVLTAIKKLPSTEGASLSLTENFFIVLVRNCHALLG